MSIPDKVVIFGSRTFTDEIGMASVLDQLLRDGLINPNPEWISGMARGADRTAYNLLTRAKQPVIQMPADWNGPHGKGAGFARNKDMAKIATKGVCFWDGQSNGTKHMLGEMKRWGHPIYMVRYHIQLDPQHRVETIVYD